MNYYKVEFSHDLKVIGTSGPQIQGIDPNCDYHVDAPYSFRKIKLHEPIQEHIRIPDMLLAKKAKWTDLMSCSMLDYLFRFVSNDLYNVLSELEFNLDSHQTIRLKLTKEQTVKNYWAFYFSHFDHTFIDWKESSFGLVDKGFAPIKDILEKYTFKNLEEYNKKYSTIFRENKFKLKNLVVRYNRANNLDLFRCHHPNSGYFCSERLKQKILEKGFTGIRFEEVKDLEKPYWPIDYIDKI